MLTLITTLLGALIGFIPELTKMFRDKADKAHEIELFKLQMQQTQTSNDSQRDMVDIQSQAAEAVALYRTYKTGTPWVDAFNGLIRPSITLGFFALYTFLKIIMIVALSTTFQDAPVFILRDTVALLWTDEDSAIFGGVLGFYFGHRSMSKIRDK